MSRITWHCLRHWNHRGRTYVRPRNHKISCNSSDSKVHGANMGPTWGRQDLGGPHVDHVNLAIWVTLTARLWGVCCDYFGENDGHCTNWWDRYPDSKVHGAYMGPTWGRQDPGGPHVGPMILAIWADLCLPQGWISHLITVMSHKHHGVSNQWEFDCLFISLSRLTRQITSKLHITGPLWRESSSYCGFPSQMASNEESMSMSWHYHAGTSTPSIPRNSRKL